MPKKSDSVPPTCPRCHVRNTQKWFFYIIGREHHCRKRKVLGVVALKGIPSLQKWQKRKKKKPLEKLEFTTYPWHRCSIYSKHCQLLVLEREKSSSARGSSEGAEGKSCLHLFSGNILWRRSPDSPSSKPEVAA